MSQKSDSVQQQISTENDNLPARNFDSSDVVSVAISRELHERIRKRLDKADFTSVDSYVSYVLSQVLDELESGDSTNNNQQTEAANPFSKEDQEGVEQRLRDLGYL